MNFGKDKFLKMSRSVKNLLIRGGGEGTALKTASWSTLNNLVITRTKTMLMLEVLKRKLVNYPSGY